MANKKETKPTAVKKTNRNFDKYFWGLLILLVGILMLLGNLRVIDFDLLAIWRLWPLAIIGLGVSLLPLRGWTGYLVSGVMILITLAAVVLVTTNQPWLPKQSSQETQAIAIDLESDSVKKADIELDYGAGEVNLSSIDSGELLRARLDNANYRLTQKSSLSGDTQKVELGVDNIQILNFTGPGRLNASLSRDVPIDLKLDAGASKIRGDISRVDLRNLEIDSGASSIDLKLGMVAAKQVVKIDVGASSVKLRLPSAAGVE